MSDQLRLNKLGEWPARRKGKAPATHCRIPCPNCQVGRLADIYDETDTHLIVHCPKCDGVFKKPKRKRR